MGQVTSIKRRRATQRALAAHPEFRALVSELVSRSELASRAGITFNGKRDYYDTLGYKRLLTATDYRERFDRDAVAARIVEAKPQSTWRGGGVVIEDETPDVETEFEEAYEVMNRRLNIWTTFLQADVLAGLGRYSIILIGAPGELDKPLTKVRGPDDIMYLQPYSEADAPISSWETDNQNSRFGQPTMYTLSRRNPLTTSPILSGTQQSNNRTAGRPLHYSRVIHIADGLLDDRINGIPRLERCWNLLDDLMKVTGGGAEAFWRRADAGLQVDVDPEMELETPDEEALDQEIDDYIHRLRRVIRTRGVKMTPLTSPVAGIKDPIDGIMSQISAGTGIPQRVLMGSERGQLASQQDDDNWSSRISDRRKAYAGPTVVIPTLNRLIDLKALPKPQQMFFPRWPEIDDLDDVQKATVGTMWATINKDMGTPVVLPNEIRDRLLGLPPLDEVAAAALPQLQAAPPEQRAAMRARFGAKWNVLTFQKKLEYLKVKMPGRVTDFVMKKRVVK